MGSAAEATQGGSRRLRPEEVSQRISRLMPQPNPVGAFAGSALEGVAAGVENAGLIADYMGGTQPTNPGGMRPLPQPPIFSKGNDYSQGPQFGEIATRPIVEALHAGAETAYPQGARGRGGYFSEQLPAGLGSSAPSMAAGLAAGPVGVALMAGAQNGVPLYHEVLDKTGDKDKAMVGLLFGNALGPLENVGAGGAALRIARKFRKVNDATGGAIEKGAMRVLLQGAASEPLQEMFEQGVLDKVQEQLTGEDLDNLERIRAVAPVSFGVGLLTGGGEALAGRMAGEGGPAQVSIPEQSEAMAPPQTAQEAPGAIQTPEALPAVQEPLAPQAQAQEVQGAELLGPSAIERGARPFGAEGVSGALEARGRSERLRGIAQEVMGGREPPGPRVAVAGERSGERIYPAEPTNPEHVERAASDQAQEAASVAAERNEFGAHPRSPAQAAKISALYDSELGSLAKALDVPKDYERAAMARLWEAERPRAEAEKIGREWRREAGIVEQPARRKVSSIASAEGQLGGGADFLGPEALPTYEETADRLIHGPDLEEPTKGSFEPVEPTKGSGRNLSEEPKAAPAEEPKPVTGIKNETVAGELEKMGLPPVEESQRPKRAERLAKAKEALAQDPRAGEHLTEELEAHPRAPTGIEGALLALEANRLIVEREAAQDAFNETPSAENRTKIDVAQKSYERLAKILKRVGSESSESLDIRQMMVARDMSLASMERQLSTAQGGGKLIESSRMELARMAKELRAAQTALEKLRAERPRRGKRISGEELGLLVSQEQIQRRFQRMIFGARRKAMATKEKAKGAAREVLAAPRAIYSSGDVSAIRRQGGIITGAMPLQSAKNIKEMFRAGASEEAMLGIEEEIKADPDYALAQSAGFELASPDSSGGKAEEEIRSTVAENLPLVKQSNRAYVTYLNLSRFHAFKSLIEGHPGGKPSVEEATAIMDFVKDISGQSGSFGKLARSLNAVGIFWSPAFAVSRFATLVRGATTLADGRLSWRSKRQIGKFFAKYAMGQATYFGMLATLGAAVAKANNKKFGIERDPRSSDWGSVRIGDLRLDPWSGLKQVATFLIREGTGQKKTNKGEVKELGGKGPYDENRLDVALRFARSKLSPVAANVVDALSGETYTGEKVSPGKALLRPPLPLALKETWDAANYLGVGGLILGAFALAGDGLSIYDDADKSEQKRPSWRERKK